MLVFLAHRYTSEGIGWTRPVIYTAAVGLTVNIGGNFVLTLGHFGIESLGALGCGIATALANWAMLATMHLYQRRHAVYRRFGLFDRFEAPDSARSARSSRSASRSRAPWSPRARSSPSRRSS
jgi:MATE family multidrug resistance protein